MSTISKNINSPNSTYKRKKIRIKKNQNVTSFLDLLESQNVYDIKNSKISEHKESDSNNEKNKLKKLTIDMDKRRHKYEKEEEPELIINLIKENSKTSNSIIVLRKIREKLLYYIKSFGYFKNFIKYNKIDDQQLSNAIIDMKYKYVPPDYIINRQGDLPSYFIILVKGKMCQIKEDLLSSSTNNNLTTNYNKYGEENNNNYKEITNGACLNECAIIYDRKCFYTTKTISECHLILLKKEKFYELFSRYVFSSDENKRTFIKKLIPFTKECIGFKFELMIKNNFTVTFYKRGDVILEENERMGKIFILYMGEVLLKKDLSRPILPLLMYPEKDTELIYNKAKETINYQDYFDIDLKKEKNDIKIKEHSKHLLFHKDKQLIIKLLSPCLCGLETVACVTKSNYSLTANSDICVLFVLDLETIKDYRDDICFSLLKEFITQEKIICEKIANIKYFYKKLGKKINFDSNLPIKKLNKLNNFIDYNWMNNKNEEYIINLNNKVDLNSGGFVNISTRNTDIFKKKNNYYEQKQVYYNLTKELKVNINNKFDVKNIDKQLVKNTDKKFNIVGKIDLSPKKRRKKARKNSIFSTSLQRNASFDIMDKSSSSARTSSLINLRRNKSNNNSSSNTSHIYEMKENQNVQKDIIPYDYTNYKLEIKDDGSVNFIEYTDRLNRELAKSAKLSSKYYGLFNRNLDKHQVCGRQLFNPETTIMRNRRKVPRFKRILNKHAIELIKKNYNDNIFVEGNIKYNYMFNRNLDISRSCDIIDKKNGEKYKQFTIYNTGSFDIPLYLEMRETKK